MGASWKAEWVALPEVCLLTGVALQLAQRLLSGLVVDAEAMRTNLDATATRLASEQILAGLTRTAGKARRPAADARPARAGTRDVHEVFDDAARRRRGHRADRRARDRLATTGDAARMVDDVVGRAGGGPEPRSSRHGLTPPRVDL